MRILIADDDELCRSMLTELIESTFAFTPDAARDGAGAWWKLSDPDSHYDLVIADVNMPEVSGIDLLTRMRAHPRFETIPVIMCSARSDRDTVTRALSLSVSEYLAKPVLPNILLGRIRHHLSTRGHALTTA